MQQTLAAQASFEKYARKTRRELFLEEMEQVVPWAKLQALIEPHYPKGENGRPPVGLGIMLRIYFVGIVFDRPDVVVHAAAAAESLKLVERCQTVAGSFLESFPEGDLHLLRFILHDWNDDIAIRILNNCRHAMRPDGRLVIVEAFLGEPGERPASSMVDTQTPLIDLHMLLMNNGRERSIAQYDALIQAAGLRRSKLTPLSSGYVIIEAGVA